MAKRLSDNLTSLYLGAAHKLKSKKSRKKIVAYVESYDDVFFWRSVLDEFENDECYFEVMLPSRTSLGKGKKTVLMNRLGDYLGQYMIACVDADYDYLMQNTNASSRLINKNPYVFHTYVYAIENYQCYAGSLHGVCVMATLNDRQLVDLEGFMIEYSRIIWPLFVWSVWVYRTNNYHSFTLMDFCEMVSFHEVNVYHPEDTLEFIRRKVNRKIASLQHTFRQAKEAYEPLKQELQHLGITPETTYLYIQGHTLFENVTLPLLVPICAVLRKEREKEIRQLAEHNIQRQNELSCYQNSQNPVDAMLRKNVSYKMAPPYQRLRQDLLNFLEEVKKKQDSVAQTDADVEHV